MIQFKVEGQITKRHPDYQINDRIHLEHINFEKGTVNIHGKDYKMLDMNFPTIDPKDPLKLTKEEQELSTAWHFPSATARRFTAISALCIPTARCTSGATRTFYITAASR